MPSAPGYKRDLKREYETQKQRGENGTGPDSDSAKRHRARRKMLKLGLVKPGQDVDHKRPLSKGGSNATANLRAEAPGKNRSFPRNKHGGMVKNEPKR